jgi:hypothetical protein
VSRTYVPQYLYLYRGGARGQDVENPAARAGSRVYPDSHTVRRQSDGSQTAVRQRQRASGSGVAGRGVVSQTRGVAVAFHNRGSKSSALKRAVVRSYRATAPGRAARRFASLLPRSSPTQAQGYSSLNYVHSSASTSHRRPASCPLSITSTSSHNRFRDTTLNRSTPINTFSTTTSLFNEPAWPPSELGSRGGGSEMPVVRAFVCSYDTLHSVKP